MKPKTAIKTLRRILPLHELYAYSNTRRAIDEAVSALEKQMPKKIEYVSDEDADRCPVCKEELDGCNYYNYCPCCGQAIDWSEVENEIENND